MWDFMVYPEVIEDVGKYLDGPNFICENLLSGLLVGEFLRVLIEPCMSGVKGWVSSVRVDFM